MNDSRIRDELEREAQRIASVKGLREGTARLVERRRRTRRVSSALIAAAIFLIPAVLFAVSTVSSQWEGVQTTAQGTTTASQTETPHTASLGSNVPECASDDDASLVTSIFADGGFDTAEEAIRAGLLNEGVQAINQSEATEIPSTEEGLATYRVELTDGRIAVVALRTGANGFVLDGLRLCG